MLPNSTTISCSKKPRNTFPHIPQRHRLQFITIIPVTWAVFGQPETVLTSLINVYVTTNQNKFNPQQFVVTNTQAQHIGICVSCKVISNESISDQLHWNIICLSTSLMSITICWSRGDVSVPGFVIAGGSGVFFLTNPLRRRCWCSCSRGDPRSGFCYLRFPLNDM